jgi:thiol:disulfide interchange protein DsbD
VADLAYGWRLLDREVFLAIWIALFGLLGAYLMGWLRFPHDEPEHRTNVPQFFLGLLSFAFTIYMIPGLWGAPLKAISAFTPPMYTQDYKIVQTTVVEAPFKDYEQGMAFAKEQHKPVIIDFTGFGCVNCRKMEAAVWTDEEVARRLTQDYVLISLYVDDKTPLPQPVEVEVNGQKRTLRTIGDKWSHLQAVKFGANTQPFYVLLNEDGMPLGPSRSYNEDIQEYLQWLDNGLNKYKP